MAWWTRVVVFVLAFPAAQFAAGDAPVDFLRDIRPILSDKCFTCHGPDPAAREAERALDAEAEATAARDGGPAVKPGDPKASLLFQRITSTDADERMPPPETKKSLAAAEIALIERWIQQGAKWSRHWAFVPPELPRLPEVSQKSWLRTPIDAFILRRLEAANLAPSPEARPETVVRRLYLDLIGLPPTPGEVAHWTQALAADGEPAHGRLVEHLLASPHFGERWGQRWLDAARYADSDGFEKDKPRFVYFYRDWVINAHNRDLPYNRFLIEQIAGDLLPGATQDQRVATGFLRNSMINEEGGVDPEQFRMEAMFDRMDAVGKGMLGLTIQCAQCHTHKFDPLTHEEYYELFACLNNCSEANIVVYTPQEQQQREEIFRRIARIEADLRESSKNWPQQLTNWKNSLKPQPQWTVVRPEEDTSGGQKHYVLDDGSVLAAGYAPTRHETTRPGEDPIGSLKQIAQSLNAIQEVLSKPDMLDVQHLSEASASLEDLRSTVQQLSQKIASGEKGDGLSNAKVRARNKWQ